MEQTVNGDLYIKGINGWDGTNATPDGTSHLQGYLSGLDTRITNNTTAIEGKQNALTAGENIDITNDVISVPRNITVENIQSPTDNTAVNIGSNPEQTKDNVYLTAWGNSSDAEILIEGSGNNNEASSIELNAYGYSDANVLLNSGGKTDRSRVFITANGLLSSEIQIVGGDDNNHPYVNIDSKKFTYNDNDVAVKPINSTFVSGNTIVLTDNYIYSGSSITSLTINGINFTGDCLIQFTTGSTTPSITIIGLVFDVLPSFNSNKYYELGIHNGHCLWVEYDS